MSAVERLARAKINLSLHIVGQRPNGYHELQSWVCFADFGDRISVDHAAQDELAVSGPFAAHCPNGADNLIARARDLLRQKADTKRCPPVSIRLQKNLPVASGLGGGSADAAATLLALNDLWALGHSHDELKALGLALGADVPMCLCERPMLAAGIGEDLRPMDGFAALDLVLVNPGVPVSTPAVFAALETKTNDPLTAWNGSVSEKSMPELLSRSRNDLQRPAIAIAPAIAECLDALDDAGAELSRMSGSGASCFGLFASASAAQKAASDLVARRPEWFVTAVRTLPSDGCS